MTSDKKICYLICVYNDQRGLEVSLRSVFQDAPLADVLIIDDGSADAITLPYQIPDNFNITLKRLPNNKGLIGALNEGLNYIYNKNYEYIARLDAGDLVEQGRLQAQMDYLDRNPQVGLLGTQLRAFNPENNETLFYFNNPTGTKNVSNILKMKNCIAHPSIMARVGVYKKAGFYDQAFYYADDYEMWRRLDKIAQVDNLPHVYVHKEITPNQMTATNRFDSNLSKLRAQIKYFKSTDMWCWLGIVRSILALLTPRGLLLLMKSNSKKLKKIA